jgi:16S rRNA (guanine527-N7)-methyltransferase
MAMKGRVPDEEILVLPDQVVVEDVQLLQVPGLEAQRCVVWMRRRLS